MESDLLSTFIKYLQSENRSVMEEACWVISNMINSGVTSVISTLIQTEHCIECFIDVLNKIEDERTINNVMEALTRSITVESGLKEVYLNKNLKEILERNNHIDKSSEIYKKLLSTFIDE